tara:strand:+ start:366 stop:593 length:228 start_codon:yes stop_codon:yes gene_type:complete
MKYKIPMLLTATVEIEIEANTFDRAVEEAEFTTFADYDGGFNPTNFEVDYDLLVDPNTVFDVDELSALVDDKDRT